MAACTSGAVDVVGLDDDLGRDGPPGNASVIRS